MNCVYCGSDVGQDGRQIGLVWAHKWGSDCMAGLTNRLTATAQALTWICGGSFKAAAAIKTVDQPSVIREAREARRREARWATQHQVQIRRADDGSRCSSIGGEFHNTAMATQLAQLTGRG